MAETASLRVRAFRGLAFFIAAMAVLIFLPAWTLLWWRAWLFLVVFAAAVLAITLYFLKRDPALIERRMNAGPAAETERTQRIIQSFASVAFAAVFVVSGLDRHFGWSHFPAAAVPVGNALVLVGLFAVFLVFRENSYTAGTIEIGSGQTVVTTGPYARPPPDVCRRDRHAPRHSAGAGVRLGARPIRRAFRVDRRPPA